MINTPKPAFYRFKYIDESGNIQYKITEEKPDENLVSISEITPLYTELPEHRDITVLVQENMKLWGWVTECEQMLARYRRA